MKYYGIRRKKQQEDRRYALQKAQARIKAKIPGKGKEYREEWYKEQYTNEGIIISNITYYSLIVQNSSILPNIARQIRSRFLKIP